MRAKERIVIEKIKKGRGYRYTLKCNFCNKNFTIMGKRYNRGEGYYCSIACANRGELRGWKGGATILKGGYIGIKTNDVRANVNGYYPEHRLVMEAHIGRKLFVKELIHHKNGNRKDNRIENLSITSHRGHCSIHNPKLGEDVQCANCNKLIYKNLYLLKKFKNLYCSKKCYLEHRWGFKQQNATRKE